GCVVGAPAHDVGIEGLGGLHVRRRQLVPDETSMRTGHACFPRSSRGGPHLRRPNLLHNRGADDVIREVGNPMRPAAFCECAPAVTRACYERLFTLRPVILSGRKPCVSHRSAWVIVLATCKGKAYECCSGLWNIRY